MKTIKKKLTVCIENEEKEDVVIIFAQPSTKVRTLIDELVGFLIFIKRVLINISVYSIRGRRSCF